MERKVDPRIIRTKKLIMKSFNKLSSQKKFDAITVKDITEGATVNRATFYYHFKDKYDLMEQVLLEDLKVYLVKPCLAHDKIDEETLKSIFLSLVKYYELVSSKCSINYQDFRTSIKEMMMNTLTEQFHHLLCKEKQLDKDQVSRLPAIILSWGIYGLINEWEHDHSLDAEQLITEAIPILLASIEPIKQPS